MGAFVVGLVTGAFVGGSIGAIALAAVVAGADRHPRRPPRVERETADERPADRVTFGR